MEWVVCSIGVKHPEKFLGILGEHLISMKISPRKVNVLTPAALKK
jgi:hypothetical protein